MNNKQCKSIKTWNLRGVFRSFQGPMRRANLPFPSSISIYVLVRVFIIQLLRENQAAEGPKPGQTHYRNKFLFVCQPYFHTTNQYRTFLKEMILKEMIREWTSD